MTTPTIIVLDGGMGKFLERSGAPFRQPEWSALALIEEPASVRRAHTAFIDAGADLIIANTYSVVPFHLGPQRYADQGSELAALAGRLAREAADAADRPILVAGSLPPLFGSYEPDDFRPAEAPAIYDELVDAQAPFVDLWIGETVSSIAEATAIADAVERGQGPNDLWMSFTVPDDDPGPQVALRSGEAIADALMAVGNRCQAITFNCSPPEAVTVALRQLHEAMGNGYRHLRTGAYANAFEPKPEVYAANAVVLDRRAELTPERYLEICQDWVDAGASIVGGCCHMHPEHIQALDAGFRGR